MSLLGQLLWREFYYTAAAHTPNYHQKEDNPICKQIPWDDNPEFFKVSPGLSADLSACLCRKALTCMTRWDTAAVKQISDKSRQHDLSEQLRGVCAGVGGLQNGVSMDRCHHAPAT